MIYVMNDVVNSEGTPEELCSDYTRVIIHLVNTFQKEFQISQQEATEVLNQCAKIAYMDGDEKLQYLKELSEKD